MRWHKSHGSINTLFSLILVNPQILVTSSYFILFLFLQVVGETHEIRNAFHLLNSPSHTLSHSPSLSLRAGRCPPCRNLPPPIGAIGRQKLLGFGCWFLLQNFIFLFDFSIKVQARDKGEGKDENFGFYVDGFGLVWISNSKASHFLLDSSSNFMQEQRWRKILNLGLLCWMSCWGKC